MRTFFLCLCVVSFGCGEKSSDSNASGPQVGQQKIGEKCGKVEDCAVGLTCGDDFKCFDPNPNAETPRSRIPTVSGVINESNFAQDNPGRPHEGK